MIDKSKKSPVFFYFSIFFSLYAFVLLITQLNSTDPAKYHPHPNHSPLQLLDTSNELSRISNPIAREKKKRKYCAAGRKLDKTLPPDSKIFFQNILGEENNWKAGVYYIISYYVFPRHVDISVNTPPTFKTGRSFEGNRPDSYEQLKSLDYKLVLHMDEKGRLFTKPLKTLSQNQTYSEWTRFQEWDPIIAFLLPIVMTIAFSRLPGMVLPGLKKTLGFWETLACSFGIGTLFSTNLILGVKLLGFSIERPLFFLFLMVSIFEISLFIKNFIRDKKNLTPFLNYHVILLLIFFIPLFFLLFRLAGLQGLVEFDAIASWMLKAKILFLYTGEDIFRWFSAPKFSYAHMDYPLLIPMLHTFTFGALGHINEFVTKFWPTWMFFLLIMALFSILQLWKRPQFFSTALLIVFAFNPATMAFVQMEGATMPLLFFTLLGSIEIISGTLKRNRELILLGLLILLCGAMSKNEGKLFLILCCLSLLLIPATRSLVFSKKNLYIALCTLIIISPSLYLNLQTPSLHPEAQALQSLFENSDRVFSNFIRTFPVQFGRLFLSHDFWSFVSPDQIHIKWAGTFNGFSSLFDSFTAGYGWFMFLFPIFLFLLGEKKEILTGLILLSILFLFFLSSCVLFSAIPRSLNDIDQVTGSGMDTQRIFYPFQVSLFIILGFLIISRQTNNNNTSRIKRLIF